MGLNLDIKTPRWSVPLLRPARYKGIKGGRSSGKSHFVAEDLIEQHVLDKNYSTVCIREIQKSLKFSAKKLIETKIRDMGVEHLFTINTTEIKRKGGSGVIIFQGMQDHTAESIKSLEGFNRAWVEEAQCLSARSLELLIPTIRMDGSELIFTWNPDQETDPIDVFFNGLGEHDDFVLVHVNFTDNPFCPQVMIDEAAAHLRRDPDSYPHVWLGAYNTKSDDQVLAGRWIVDDIEPDHTWNGPYYGVDWGFSTDPTVLTETFIKGNKLLVCREAYEYGVEVDDIPKFMSNIPDSKKHVSRADSARPELISYAKRKGYPKMQSVVKWPGSVEDGVSKLRSFDIVIHSRCEKTIEEARLWKYKRDRLTGDILPVLIDKNNHCWDSIRYGIQPVIKEDPFGDLLDMAMRKK